MKECPVCGNWYKNLSLHFSKNIKTHREYIDIELKKVKKQFEDGVFIKDIQSPLSYKIINSFLSENSNYYEIMKSNRSLVAKNRKVNRKYKKREQIINLFNSALSIVKICEKVGCHENTLKKIWKDYYGVSSVEKRIYRISQYYKKKNKEYCSVFARDPEKYNKIVKFFVTDKSINYVGELLNVSPATVSNIWKKAFGEASYNKRKIRLKKISPNKHLGSKNEILCYKLIKLSHKHAIHHDYSIVKGLEIDITIPNIKVAINWDGVVHRLPIYGEKRLRNVQDHDRKKISVLEKLNWTHIIIEDNGSYNPKFVEEKVEEIQEIIKNKNGGTYYVN